MSGFKTLDAKTQKRIVLRLRTTRHPFDTETVAKLLDISKVEVSLLEHREPFVWWSREKITEAVRRYLVSEKKWPRYKDFVRANGLPSPHTMWSYARSSSARWSMIDWVQASIAEAEGLSPEEAFLLPNMTHRARAMGRIDMAKAVKSGLATMIKKDKYGKLWNIQMGDDLTSTLAVVEVKNATKEPDGTFTNYYLRVPPTTTCPHQGVAWSFGFEENWKSFKVDVAT